MVDGSRCIFVYMYQWTNRRVVQLHHLEDARPGTEHRRANHAHWARFLGWANVVLDRQNGLLNVRFTLPTGLDKIWLAVDNVHMKDSRAHYHVWVLEIRTMEDSLQMYFDDVPDPTAYVHRTSANRVRNRIIASGTRPELVRVRACQNTPNSPCRRTETTEAI